MVCLALVAPVCWWCKGVCDGTSGRLEALWVLRYPGEVDELGGMRRVDGR